MINKERTEEKLNAVADGKTPDDSTETTVNAALENDSSLESLVREEQSNARRRAQEELKREPTQKEADEWLDAHTEGY